MESFTLDKLAKIIGGDVLGVGDFIINSIEDSSTCSSGICYLKDKKYLVSLGLPTNPGDITIEVIIINSFRLIHW